LTALRAPSVLSRRERAIPKSAQVERAEKLIRVKQSALATRLNGVRAMVLRKVEYTVKPRIITLGLSSCKSKPLRYPSILWLVWENEYELVNTW